MKVLIGEDDPEVAEAVGMALSMRWSACESMVGATGAEILKASAAGPFDLVILDINLPDQSGFEVLRSLRKTSQVPVMMLTVRGSDQDKVRGLELGADDYLVKPFSPYELLARITAVLRRSQERAANVGPVVLKAGPLSLNPDTAEVQVDERQVRLSPTEFRILELLVRNAGKMVKPDAILKEVWGIDRTANDGHLIKLHMQNLRRKLGDNASQPRIVVTIRGFGYKVAT